MRDDIHKGAHVSSVWRSFVRCSARDADWSTKGAKAAEKAILSSAAEISQRFIRAVGSILIDPQMSLPGSRANLEQMRLRMPLSTLESRVVDSLIDEVARGPLSNDSMARCVNGALLENVESQLRAIEVHVQVRSPEDRPELMRRMQFLLGRVNLSESSVDHLRAKPGEQEVNPGFDWEQNIGGRP